MTTLSTLSPVGFNSDTQEFIEPPADYQVVENFEGEVSFIQAAIETVLSSQRLAKAYVESGCRFFIVPIDSEQALYSVEVPALLIDSSLVENSPLLERSVRLANKVYDEKPDEVVVYFTFKYGKGKDDRAHYVTSTSIQDLEEIYSQSQPRGFKN